MTLEGMVMLVNPVQPQKAPLPIEVTLEGMVMLVNPVQSSNAYSPIEVTLEGIVTLVNHPVHLLNAEELILVTVYVLPE